MAAKKTTVNKSDFIRQHASLSTAEVIAKAKAAGLKVSSSLVYMVRGRVDAKKGQAKKAKKTSTAKPVAAAPAPSTKSKVSKAAFIRSLPKDMPVAEVIAKGKAQGLKLAETYVSWARWAGKKANKKSAKAAAPATKPSAPTVQVTTRATPRNPTLTNGVRSPVSSSAETLLRAVAAEIGLGRAIEILAGERARVHSILRGVDASRSGAGCDAEFFVPPATIRGLS
jgi:hypothetical protein